MNNKLISIIQNDCAEAANWGVSILDGLKNSKVYISGGTGFMGTWLAEFICYLNDNHNFNVALELVSRDVVQFKVNHQHISNRKNVNLISKDVRNINEIPDDVNYIIHAAASPDNRTHISDPLGTISTIIKGTENIIDNAYRLANLKKFLHLSSGQIYGKLDSGNESIAEHDFGILDCNSIISIYPEAKRCAESICCGYYSLYKLPLVIARPFSFIGPFQLLNKPWAANNFINDALLSKSLRIIGNGKPVRTYMYPSDMAVWLLKILLDGVPNKAYNVGSPHGITLEDLTKKIIYYSGSSAIVEIKNNNEDNSKYVPNTTLCNKELGLKINHDIDETIKKAVVWFKELVKNQ